MLAGEPFSDRPRSVCPVIAGFLRAYNDGLDDDRRQDLYAYAARAVDSRGSRELGARRRRMCAERAAGSASWLRSLLGGSAGAGKAAARTFLEAGGDHCAALAFLDGLIEATEPPASWGNDSLEATAANLARLDSR